MGQRRCAAPGCGRFVGARQAWCPRHLKEESDDPGEAGFDELTEETGETPDDFHQRIQAGEYRELFGEQLNEIIQQAASDPGLADEIGILRVVLARILMEERDPARLAASIARVAAVAIQAARTQRAITGGSGHGISDAMTQVLCELNVGATPEVTA